MECFETTARAVYEGRLSFTAFARATGKRWEALAGMIRRRWALPAWVEHEDLVQDLLLGAWEAIWRWDEKRAPRIERYLVWNAVDKAKKRAHKARGAVLHGSVDGHPSRHEWALAAFTEEGEAAVLAELVAAPAQDQLGEWEARLAYVAPACESGVELVAMAAVAAELSVQGGAERLYRDPILRLECGLRSARHAERVVAKVAADVAQRMATPRVEGRVAA